MLRKKMYKYIVLLVGYSCIHTVSVDSELYDDWVKIPLDNLGDSDDDWVSVDSELYDDWVKIPLDNLGDSDDDDWVEIPQDTLSLEEKLKVDKPGQGGDPLKSPLKLEKTLYEHQYTGKLKVGTFDYLRDPLKYTPELEEKPYTFVEQSEFNTALSDQNRELLAALKESLLNREPDRFMSTFKALQRSLGIGKIMGFFGLGKLRSSKYEQRWLVWQALNRFPQPVNMPAANNHIIAMMKDIKKSLPSEYADKR